MHYKNPRFGHEGILFKTLLKTSQYISIGNQSGEGWFLMGEMIEFIERYS